jgi:hypothetical protein
LKAVQTVNSGCTSDVNAQTTQHHVPRDCTSGALKLDANVATGGVQEVVEVATAVGACHERVLAKARAIMRGAEAVAAERTTSAVGTRQARMALALQLDAYQAREAARGHRAQMFGLLGAGARPQMRAQVSYLQALLAAGLCLSMSA